MQKGVKIAAISILLILALGVIAYINRSFLTNFLLIDIYSHRETFVRTYRYDDHLYCVEAFGAKGLLSTEVRLREKTSRGCGGFVAGFQTTENLPISEFKNFWPTIVLPDKGFNNVDYVLVLQDQFLDISCDDTSEGPCSEFPYELQSCIHPDPSPKYPFPKRTCINEHSKIQDR